MKRVALFLLVIVFLSFGARSQACVGRILNIGVTQSVNENLLGELVSVLINERTGTTVNIKVFKDTKELYNSFKKEELGIVIENTDHAMNMLNMPNSADKEKDYDTSKKEFREKMNLIWLKPFGFMSDEKGGGKYFYAAVITEDVLINFPALPRVINKLNGISNDTEFNKVVKTVKSGEKVKRAARDFLKKKKLI